MTNWLSPDCLPRTAIPEALRKWLFLPGSMTKALRQQCMHSFVVNVLSHRWNKPRFEEWQALNIKRQSALVRETYLMCDGIPVVFARSIFPKCALVGKHAALCKLGNKPIGDVIYHPTTPVRRDLKIAKLYPGQQDYESAVSLLTIRPALLWARRTIIELNTNPLLISEIFLPAIYS